VETIGSKRSYALIWCMPNNDDDDCFHDLAFMMCCGQNGNFLIKENLNNIFQYFLPFSVTELVHFFSRIVLCINVS